MLSDSVLNKIKNHGLVLYDGDCGFCQFWVQFILDRDPAEYFLFTPLQSTIGKTLHQLPADSQLTTVLLFENNKLYDKSTAALRIAGKLLLPWNLLKHLLIVPAFIRNFIYDFIAKRRHNLSMRNKCRLLTSDERRRFIE